MARHDVDPVLRQLVRAINESGQAAVPVTVVSLEAGDAWTLRARVGDAADDRGPFERLLGSA